MSSPAPNDLNLDKSAWNLTRLGDLASDVNDRVSNPAESEQDRFVGLEHFESGDLKIKSWKATDGLVSAAKAFKSGDVLFARRNAYLKRASMVDFDGVCSGDAFVLREDHDKVVPGYLAFVMNSRSLWRHAISNAAGTMSKRVKWRDLANYEFLLPPKDQQAKLADLLWDVDGAIEAQLNLRVSLETEYRALVENLITGQKIVSKDSGKYSFRDPTPKDEKHWKEYRLSELCAKITDGEHLSPKFVESGRPILSAKDITTGSVVFDDCKYLSQEAFDISRRRCNPSYDDVLIISRGATIGRTVVNKENREFALMGSVIVLKPNERILGDYLGEVVQRRTYQRRLMAMSGSTAQQAIYLADIAKSKIVAPNPEYQGLVVECLGLIKKSQDVSNGNLAVSRSLLKSLINQIF